MRTSGPGFRLTADELGMPERIRCPFCGGSDTELHSPFGPQLSVATYWCRPCRSPVEWLKWRPRDAVTDPAPGAS